MRYPVLIHKDKNSEFGITIPDIPGCFTAGKTIDEALGNLQDAVMCYYEGEDISMPPNASKIEDLLEREDIYKDKGFWLMADIDFSFISTNINMIKIKAMKALFSELGKADTIRFLSHIIGEKRDYLQLQDKLFKDISIYDIYKDAAQPVAVEL